MISYNFLWILCRQSVEKSRTINAQILQKTNKNQYVLISSTHKISNQCMIEYKKQKNKKEVKRKNTI